MLLKRMDYNGHKEEANYWEVSDLVFGPVNLIVGQNATGKTRIMNVLKNVTRQVAWQAPRLYHGETTLTFVQEEVGLFEYRLHIRDGKVLSETIKMDEKTVLDREGQMATFGMRVAAS